MHIRKFMEADRQAVIALWTECELTRPWNDPAKDIDRKMLFQPDLFFVGILDSRLMASAMAGYDGHRGSVFYLAVHPDCQGRGYGQRLMAFIEDTLIGLGCPKLNIAVRTSNDPVLGFYDNLAYKKDDVFCIGKRLIPDV